VRTVGSGGDFNGCVETKDMYTAAPNSPAKSHSKHHQEQEMGTEGGSARGISSVRPHIGEPLFLIEAAACYITRARAIEKTFKQLPRTLHYV